MEKDTVDKDERLISINKLATRDYLLERAI